MRRNDYQYAWVKVSTDPIDHSAPVAIKTFEEIAKILGCTRGNCHKAYQSAMKKIRAHPEAANRMRELVNLKSARVF